jgi:uncharacterized protein YbaR (Trm112 family)
MFIELTDHLICPAPHEEQYLVLLPGEMDGRRVVTGALGCPACGRIVRVMDGVAEFGPAPGTGPSLAPPAPAAPAALTAEAMTALLGLGGPGGFVALIGSVGALAAELVERMPGIALALVNPPGPVADTLAASVIRSDRLPLKTSSMRGIVVGPDFAGQSTWIADAVRAVLPGLRVVALGSDPPETLELLGRTADCWVAEKRPAVPRP